MSVWCCPECFDDRGLRKDIIPSLSTTQGVCDFCGSASYRQFWCMSVF